MGIWKRMVLGAVAITTAFSAQASTVTYYHNDLVGSPIAATNGSGQVIWKERYRPFGERVVKDAASSSNDVWFTSRRQDETGLIYMGARYYDPVVGRFISTDPKQFDEMNPHLFNRYAYANNNPYKYNDPTGRGPEFLAFCVAPVTCGVGVVLTIATAYYGVETIKRTARALNVYSQANDSDDKKGDDTGSKSDDKSKAKPNREQRPDDVPSGTKPVDEDKRLDREKIHGIKDQLRAGARDWVGIDKQGNIWTNEGGEAANQGHYTDFEN